MTIPEIHLQEFIPIPPPCPGDVTCFSYLLHGAIIGAAIAIPVGPIAFLCMQYALSKGFRIAFAAGVGAALADACFGMIAGLGLTVITDWIILNKCWIQFAGGILLCYIGLELSFTKTHQAVLIDKGNSRLNALGSTFMLTLANPLTIFAFMALFGYFELVDVTNNMNNSAMTIIGVFLGSLAWWTALTYSASRLKNYFSEKGLIRFSEFAGLVLLICGIYAIFNCL